MERALDCGPLARRGLGDDEDRVPGAAGGGGQLEPVEHEVGDAPEQELVLEAERLALDAVPDDDPAAPMGTDGGELGGGRERAATAAEEAALVDRGRQRPDVEFREPSVAGRVLFQRGGDVPAPHAGEQPRLRAGGRVGRTHP